MEIAESIGWVALGFLPVFGSMEVAWRLGKRGFFRPSTKKRTIMKKVSVDALHK